MTILRPYVPGTYESDTPPAPVRELAYYITSTDGDNIEPELVMTFLFSEDEYNTMSEPTRYKVKINFLNAAAAAPADARESRTIYTQGNLRFYLEELKDNIKIDITSINNSGESPETVSFVLPIFDIIQLDVTSPTFDLLSSSNIYDGILSRTQETFYDKSRVIKIYTDVDYNGIEADLAASVINDGTYSLPLSDSLGTSDSVVTGTEKYINDTIYSDIPQDGVFVRENAFNDFFDADWGGTNLRYSMKFKQEQWSAMTPEEIDFVLKLKETVQEKYIKYIGNNGLTRESPVVLKFIINHPQILKDSLIIYMMEGKQWQI